MRLNYLCPINQLGYGIVGINLLKALDALGHEVTLFPMSPPGEGDLEREDFPLVERTGARAAFFDPKAPCLRVWHQSDMSKMVGRGIHAGFPIFELDRFTDAERHHLSTLDVVFATSKWAAEVTREQLGAGFGGKVVVAPLGVDRKIFYPVEKVQQPGEPTVFVSIGKFEKRKGHEVMGEAFNRAFGPNDNVLLVMNCVNPFLMQGGRDGNQDWARMYLSSRLGQAGRIKVVGQRLPSQRHVADLIRQVDCGLFPSHAEGWNLECLEMMACGKHVICTNYSAHTEYADRENALLIDVDRLEDANDGLAFNGFGRWAHFGARQMEQFVEHLREVHRRKQEGRLGVNRKGIETAERFSWERTGELVMGALGA